MKPQTRAERLFDYFMDKEGHWITTFELERLAGRRSWRTRVSDCRQRARLLRRDIENTQRRVRRGTRTYVDSRYRLVKVSRKQAA